MTRRAPRNRRGGQILPMFALTLVAILAFVALLFDGANMLVQRRTLQNAGDAAVLAGSNLIQLAGSNRLCSTDATGTTVRTDVRDAVVASLAVNAPGFDPTKITISCPLDLSGQHQAVRVDMQIPSTNFFGKSIGYDGTTVATTSVAVNGRLTTSKFNVVLLNPSNAGWPAGRRGCPSFLVSGGPSLAFDGSVMINSACTSAAGGALGTNGSSATITLAGSSTPLIKMVGGYTAGPLTITPAPMVGQPAYPDPLLALDPPDKSLLVSRSATKLTLNNETRTLLPGIYTGGIELKNSSIAFLRPGIYYLDGGPLSIGAQAQFCSITLTATPTDCGATWPTVCGDFTCGVLVYKTVPATDTAQDKINIGAGATLKLRAYDERANSNLTPEYRNLLMWQGRTPVPTSSYQQPDISLSGGGSVDIGGTLYAPSAKVMMNGGSGGAGGAATEITLQFITWDLELSGNSSFHFFYNSQDFPALHEYGLIQ